MEETEEKTPGIGVGGIRNANASELTIGEEFSTAQEYSFWRRVVRLVRVRTKMFGLLLRNKTSKQAITGDTPAVVSLTTHGHRIRLVHYAIESIGRGNSRPQRVILWLDDPAAMTSLPRELIRLQSRGLEIKIAKNYGPHTKYYPYVASRSSGSDLALVTADDDTIYPKQWLRNLIKALHEDPSAVWCYRAHRLTFKDGVILPYSSWKRATSSVGSYRNFATGVSGVAYPPKMQDALKENGSIFTEFAPRADDIWLHAIAVRSGFRVRQVGSISREFDIVRGTWAGGLVGSNTSGGNDVQIRSTYTDQDRSKILSDGE
ncbi:glycosyltransferase family 2 protein [Arthrobacter yangruifuii]|uniref:Glycosyltransferase family 2 protein n=1 Tax=Arthrobacter yangruifuii TaxID=2606616 RepID=A0A5N6MFR4_9MICC|nr:glycosyltransferase family A protein [Arthrobacter yangruifuii]KAD3515261.1 glycosyltransferase family 2 protein [Arthrobacter yangruifuii]